MLVRCPNFQRAILPPKGLDGKGCYRLHLAHPFLSIGRRNLGLSNEEYLVGLFFPPHTPSPILLPPAISVTALPSLASVRPPTVVPGWRLHNYSHRIGRRRAATHSISERRGRNLQLQFGIMSRSSAGPCESEFQYHLFPSPLPPPHIVLRVAPLSAFREGIVEGREEADRAAESVICAVSTATVISWYDSFESSPQTEGMAPQKANIAQSGSHPFQVKRACLKNGTSRIADFLAAAPLFSSPLFLRLW